MLGQTKDRSRNEDVGAAGGESGERMLGNKIFTGDPAAGKSILERLR
jgi:hypothetical protein